MWPAPWDPSTARCEGGGSVARGWRWGVYHVLVLWQKLCHNLISIFDWQDHIGVLIRIRLHCEPSARGQRLRSPSLCRGNRYALSSISRLGVFCQHRHKLHFFVLLFKSSVLLWEKNLKHDMLMYLFQIRNVIFTNWLSCSFSKYPLGICTAINPWSTPYYKQATTKN